MDSNGKITGAACIAGFVRTLPLSPGVYRMLGEKGEVLYVGKAKSLKKRVTSYTQPERNTLRIQRMIALTHSMEFTVTHTEAEALLLEANLIRKLKPRYNILLRDDKSFPYIMITNHDFPQVTKHRGAKEGGGEFFGPFASGYAVNETLAVLQKAFKLRNCTDSTFALRTRPCLQFHIKRCTAPCVGRASHEQYAAQVEKARAFLKGRSREIQEEFAAEMQKASDALDFEAAAEYRDRIRALTQIQAHQQVNVAGIDSADILALHREEGGTCVQVFFFRAGHNFGNRAFFPRHEKDDANESIIAAFAAQFYAARPAPREIILSLDTPEKEMLSEALSERAGYKVSVMTPSRGMKKELVEMALKNAKEALSRKMAADASQAEIMERLAELFSLDSAPERIEVYDNSHISGSHALGAMIVAGPEGFQKNAYRKFNMDKKIAGDDYAMMRDMLTRRFKSAANPVRPDLILIDGGQGQLNAVLEVMADLGLSDIPAVAIAKGPDRNAGRERFFLPGGEAPLELPAGDPVLYFLQRVRDEAHRFAITSHRAKRSKSISLNPLDEIPGIGGRRKKALLMHFGSAKAVAEAGVADLQKVSGISKSVAERIYAFFHDNT